MAVIGNSLAPYFTAVSTDVFSANGTGNTFSLSRNISNLGDIEVVVNNIQQNPYSGSYSVSGNTLTFSEAPLSGSNNVVVTYRQATLGSTIPTPNTVGNNALQRDLSLTGNTTTQHLVPAANITYDIGTTNMRYRDLYLSGNTINLGDIKLSTNGTSFSVANATGGVFASALGNTVITGTLTSNTTTITGNVSVTGNTVLTGTLAIANATGNTFSVISNGQILVGTDTVRSQMISGGAVPYIQIEGTSQNTRFVSFTYNANNTNSPIIVLGKTRSTTVGGYSAVSANDELGQISFEGANGTVVAEAASIVAYADASFTANGSGYLTFRTANTTTSGVQDRVRITSSGLVGIGTTTPNEKLVVSGNAKLLTGSVLYVENPGGGRLGEFGTNTTGTYVKSYNGSGEPLIFDSPTGYMSMYVGGAERIKIAQTTGYVGIACTSPTTYLDINPQSGSHSYGATVRFLRSSVNVGENTFAVQKDGSTSSEDFSLYASSTSYTNSTTTGWGQFRILNARTNSSVYNYATYQNGTGVSIYFRGDGQAYADGSWNGGGADYAEYFESLTGQQIPHGTTVVLENGKVRASTQQDNANDIIGVVRPKNTSAVIGNHGQMKWTKKYLTDEYGEVLKQSYSVVKWEEETESGIRHVEYRVDNIPNGVIVPDSAITTNTDDNGVLLEEEIINPDYDSNAIYVPREKRDEWVVIGLVGQVPINKNQPIGNRWLKMKDISNTVEMWFIR